MTTTDAPARVRYKTLAGNLTRDPELRFSSKWTPWTTCGLAVTPRVRTGEGTWEDGETAFYELVSFGDLAEHVADLTKGTRVIAYGRLETDEWTTRDGERRTTAKLVCDEAGVSLRYATVDVRHTTHRERTARDGAYDEEPF